MDTERAIHISGIQNIRDLGGLVGLDGRKIRKLQVIRSSRLINMGEDGFRFFKDIHLSTVIDLRTSAEAEKRPNPKMDGVTMYRIGVLGEDRMQMGEAYNTIAHSQNEDDAMVAIMERGFDMSNVYMNFIKLPSAVAGMKRALDIIADLPEGEAILYHCNGGKDRTGTLTVFLLTILGVSMDDIADDFEMTNLFFKDEIERLKDYARTKTTDQRVIDSMQDIGGVSRRNMQKVVDTLTSEYGSVIDYVKKGLGVDDAMIQKIRDRYLED